MIYCYQKKKKENSKAKRGRDEERKRGREEEIWGVMREEREEGESKRRILNSLMNISLMFAYWRVLLASTYSFSWADIMFKYLFHHESNKT